MNNCCFTGYFTENPRTSVIDNVVLAEFVIVTYTYRKTKSTGEKSKIPTYLHCEAWHTGAETLKDLLLEELKLPLMQQPRTYQRMMKV